ncbi:MAG: SDR family NAD(P)-dependent oxidoreductase, partial [Synechococcaceae cyanobacterium]|nr:SDR family NAD(P)-dependent oxidoreductase [Synechococcaceae cyanobacterium]
MTSPEILRTPAQLFDLSGRRAVVSGASSGIGQRAALVLATAGAEVLLVARRGERLEALRHQHPDLADRLLPVALDLNGEGAAQLVAERARQVLGGCDIVVAAAGVPGRAGTREFEAEAFERVLHQNVTLQAALTAALYPCLEASGQGRVIHVA